MGKFKYYKSIDINSSPKNIQVIIFDTSRYGKYSHAINFDDPVSEKEAVKEVEKYLSKTMETER